uniref:Uncharacterized protein n=1 Tax=Anguilla anguilla TaxID=7936 RepID=A0A0E9RPW7_ANGAN
MLFLQSSLAILTSCQNENVHLLCTSSACMQGVKKF